MGLYVYEVTHTRKNLESSQNAGHDIIAPKFLGRKGMSESNSDERKNQSNKVSKRKRKRSYRDSVIQ